MTRRPRLPDGSTSAHRLAAGARSRLASWQPGLATDADARAWGGLDGWFRAAIEGRLDGMVDRLEGASAE
jgi:hypothetical protein